MTHLIIFVFIATAFAFPPPEPEVKDVKVKAEDVKSESKEGSVILKVDTNNTKSNINDTSSNLTIPEKPSQNTVTNVANLIPSPDSGALLRLVLVLLGICTIGLVYVSCRFYRAEKGGSRPTTVRKYGVLTQRTDIEMLPLPLEDDEDDDTVFDVGNHVNR